MPKPMSRSVKVSCGNQESASSSDFLLKMLVKFIYYIFQMSIREEMLAYFQEPHIHTKILAYVQKHNLDVDQLDESALLRMMEDLQLLDDIQKKVAQEESLEIINGKTHHLTLTIHKGRKFKQLSQLPKFSTFYFLLLGFDQKSKSSSYQPAENFSLSQKMSLKIKTNSLKADNNQNLQLIVVATLEGGQKIIYSLKLVEWRFILVYGSVSIDLELAPYRHDGLTILPCVGVLSITLAIASFPKHYFIQELKLTRQLQLEQKLKESANNKFHNYANSFWGQIKNLHRSLQTRRIPIYAQTEDKIYVALPKMIKPIYGIRGIDSPHHALRFCSLISFTQLPNNRQIFMRRFSTLLAGAQGSVDDHCHLLCSLLLGMGLKSYVCVGTTGKGEHSWVMTEGGSSVTFWECTKGIKLDYFSTKALTFYKTIHAVYNHHQYYANLQLDDSISGTKFNFKDQNLWKKMEETLLDELPPFNKLFSLAFPSLNPYSIQQELQSSLVTLISDYRTKLKLSFAYDEILSSLLATALANYQNQRVTGTTFCEEEFQTAIKGHIPAKHTFKAFPIQLTTYDADQIMSQILQQPKAKEILNTKGESVFFGVRTKLVIFPDNIFALWLCLAVRYYKLD